MESFLVRVTGRVQGVWFRDNTKKIADSLGIAGWVRNEENGSVLIAAEGEKKNLQKFLSWCEKGPDLAQVKKVELQKMEASNFKTFEIQC